MRNIDALLPLAMLAVLAAGDAARPLPGHAARAMIIVTSGGEGLSTLYEGITPSRSGISALARESSLAGASQQRGNSPTAGCIGYYYCSYEPHSSGCYCEYPPFQGQLCEYVEDENKACDESYHPCGCPNDRSCPPGDLC